jgi:hypothetical protein
MKWLSERQQTPTDFKDGRFKTGIAEQLSNLTTYYKDDRFRTETAEQSANPH